MTEAGKPIDRRNFLRLGSSTLVLLGGTPLEALARPAGRQPVLVVVFQRGAADALHMDRPVPRSKISRASRRACPRGAG